MNRKTFQDGMKLLSGTWPDRSPSKETTAAYWLALNDLADEVFMRAVGIVLRRSTFFPAPAEIRRHAEDILAAAGVLPAEPETAWEAVLRMARRWSPYTGNPIFEDEAIGRTVSELGGIGRIALAANDELPFIRRDFLSRYEVYRRRAIDGDPEIMSRSLPDGASVPQLPGKAD